MGQDGAKRAKIGQGEAKMEPRWGQDGAKGAKVDQDGAKMGPKGRLAQAMVERRCLAAWA